MNAIATFPTAHAERHLASMCKHFVRKIPVTSAGQSGTLVFPFGRCDMVADEDNLTLIASSADKAQLDQVVNIVSSHIERFAFRENPDLTWRLAVEPQEKT